LLRVNCLFVYHGKHIYIPALLVCLPSHQYQHYLSSLSLACAPSQRPVSRLLARVAWVSLIGSRPHEHNNVLYRYVISNISVYDSQSRELYSRGNDVSAQEVIMKLVNSVVPRHVRNRRPSISIRLARQGCPKLGMRFLDFVGGPGCKTWKVGQVQPADGGARL
jgi:hypothetical protein